MSAFDIGEYESGTTVSGNISNYTIDSRIGGGGFCHVYLATYNSGKKCALKHFHSGNLHERETYWGRERDALNLLNQFTTVEVMELIEAFKVRRNGEENHLLAIEFVPGETLEKWVPANFPIPYERAVDIMHMICQPLGHMHKNGWVHRDLSPRNIIITPNDNPVVIDWGAARQFATVSPQAQYTIIGSRGVFPPECKVGRPVTPQTDIYMLGILFNLLLTASVRNDPLNPMQSGQQIDFEVHPRDFQSQIPQIFDDIVAKCTQEDPKSRFESVEKLMRSLQDARDRYTGVECPACHELVPKTNFCGICGKPISVEVFTVPALEIPLTGGEIRIKPHEAIGRGAIMDSRAGLLPGVDLDIFRIASREESGGNFKIAPSKDDPKQYWIMDLGSDSRHTNPIVVDGKVIPKQKWIALLDGSNIAIASGAKRIDMKFVLRTHIWKKESM